MNFLQFFFFFEKKHFCSWILKKIFSDPQEFFFLFSTEIDEFWLIFVLSIRERYILRLYIYRNRTLSDDDIFFFFFLNLLLHELFNTRVQLEILLAPVLVYGPFEIYTFFTRCYTLYATREHALRIHVEKRMDPSFVIPLDKSCATSHR